MILLQAEDESQKYVKYFEALILWGKGRKTLQFQNYVYIYIFIYTAIYFVCCTSKDRGSLNRTLKNSFVECSLKNIIAIFIYYGGIKSIENIKMKSI